MLREELERLSSILMVRQNEYDALVAKYYEETNQATSRNGEESSSLAYYKNECDRLKKSLTDHEG